MADSAAFSYLCDALEQRTSLDRLEARGTVRLALKSAGLEARDVTPEQMKVVVEKILETELTARGIDDAAGVCRALESGLAQVDAGEGASADSPEAVFERLGG